MRHEYEPYLSRKSWSAAELGGIGFFDDGLSEEQFDRVLNDQRWVTPTHHLKPCGVVLCTTGAFSPFHVGHLRMLEIAKAEIEERGWKVAGAYVIPDHDDYVSSKAGGVAACPASERIHQARLVLKDHSWIQVDPWAALYQDRQLNYTTILERTARMLDQVGGYTVVYVFGSDNAGFKDAFEPSEFVCVGRPGAGDSHPQALDVSSTQIRMQMEVVNWSKPTEDCPYVIRADLDWATAGWGVHPRATAAFLVALQAAICAAVQSATRYLYVEDQQKALTKIAEPYVSFDRITGSVHCVSRVFDACSLQDRSVARLVGSCLSDIPAGRYALVDDDIASGSTMTFIRQQTPQIEWTKEISLAQLVVPGPHFDIVDARDFLFGSRLGGLMVSDGFRVPYITPWVDLTSRAKIPPARQPAFVQAVIAANLAFFKEVPVTVRQTNNAAFWLRLGYKELDTMAAICEDLLTWNPN